MGNGTRPTPEFRREAVRRALSGGRTSREIAPDLGIGLSTLTRWRSRERDDGEPSEVPSQRSVLHFYRNAFSLVPSDKIREAAKMLEAIHGQEDRKAAAEKMQAVIAELRSGADQGRRTTGQAQPRHLDQLRLYGQPLDQD